MDTWDSFCTGNCQWWPLTPTNGERRAKQLRLALIGIYLASVLKGMSLIAIRFLESLFYFQKPQVTRRIRWNSRYYI